MKYVYFAALVLVNAPGWIWSKIAGKPFDPIGGAE